MKRKLAAALGLTLALALLARAPASAQDEDHTKEAPAGEGELDNDVFVPLAEAAAKAFEAGDQALARARKESAPAEAARLLEQGFERWLEALNAGGPGASVAAVRGEQRLFEGVRAALLRRLGTLTPLERQRWGEREGARAEAEWSALRADPLQRVAPLGELVRRHPLTATATRATLELADLALESGLAARARAWLARGASETCAETEPGLRAALATRLAALQPAEDARAQAWTRAEQADLGDSVRYVPDGARRASASPSTGERWLRAGGAFFGRRSFVLQTAAELLLFTLAESGDLDLAERVRGVDLLGGLAPDTDFEPPREPPGWPLLPLIDAHGAVLVLGRSRRAEPNALVALEFAEPPAADGLAGLGLELGRARADARLRWAIVGSERLAANGERRPVPELEELGDYEFQPGPVACADLVVAQVRRTDGQVRAWALAFDARDGQLAWKRLLALGGDRVATSRFSPVARSVAGQPLLSLEPLGQARVFAGTHLGLGVLLDGDLGEPLWSFKNRRRDERDAGWNGDRPLLGGDGASALVLWAPMDSDRLYSLLPGPLAEGQGAAEFLPRPPAHQLDAQRLLAGDADTHLVQGSMGKERMLSARRGGLDRADALELGQDERFQGLGLASAQRAWVCTNRALYLFDRTRELYLLDRTPLPASGPDLPGGDVYAHDAHVLVVGPSAIWSFQVR
ncbi:MAG: hypothetical protein EXS08_07560 [Planctomycetes bacterium]|nr:hypothetical protein [Planctomycetota bacterium]